MSLSDAESGGLSIREHLAAATCTTPGRPLMLAKHDGLKMAILFRPNCKRWACEYCGPNRARWFMVVAAYGHEVLTGDGKVIQFATITSNAKIRTVAGGISRWRENWPKLMRRMKRQSENMDYLQIPEQHKDGAYHVHLLTTASVSKRWLKDNAASCGFGYIADIEQVLHAGKAASYVAKYLTKQSHALKWPRYFRRVNTSREWPRPHPLEKNAEWAVTRLSRTGSVRSRADLMRFQGWHVDTFTE